MFWLEVVPCEPGYAVNTEWMGALVQSLLQSKPSIQFFDCLACYFVAFPTWLTRRIIKYRCSARLCLTLCDPMDCSLPGFSVHGIPQARILEWFAISYSRGSSRPRDQTCISCIAGGFFTAEPPGKPNEATDDRPSSVPTVFLCVSFSVVFTCSLV